MSTEEMQKLAQQKLAEASRLVHEAAQLAKKGQFLLEFNEGGVFVPSIIDDEEALRPRALEILKSEGKSNGGEWVKKEGAQFGEWVPNPTTPFEELTEEQVEEELEGIIQSMRDEVPYMAMEYGSRDTWWQPSNC
jgi:hypothetical protein